LTIISDLTIARKARWAISFIALFMLVSISFWFLTLNRRVRLSTDAISTVELDMVLHEYETEAYRWLMDLVQFAHSGTEFKRELDPAKCRFGLWHSSFKVPYSQKEFREPFDRIGEIHKNLHLVTAKIISLLRSKKTREAFNVVNSDMIGSVRKMQEEFSRINQFMGEKQREAKNRLKGLNIVQYTAIGFFALFWALFTVFALRYSNSIFRSLSDLTRVVSSVSEGNLQVKVDAGDRYDEIGVLERSFQKMLFSLQELTGMLSAIARSSPLAYISCDLEGRISFFSPAAEKLTEYSSKEILGRSVDILMPEKYKELHHRAFMSAVKKGGFVSQAFSQRRGRELEVLAKSGREIPCEIYLSEVFQGPDASKRLVGFSAIFLDLSEKKKLQAQLIHQEKMASVGQLAAGMAHEINNPLGVILGFAQSVIRKTKEGDAISMPLQSIEREAQRCKSLVQNLLTFSRIGKTGAEECDLNATIGASLSLVESEMKMESVQLARKFEEGLPKIVADRSQIEKIIINLCRNALDAMSGKGGTLTVQTGRANRENQECVEIQVRDTGTGIPEEIRNRIFDPFFTTKEPGKGTGLGLSLVNEMVQKHKGSIEIESELGKGTLFRVLLPVV
jgi:PAS domain S-box-containing protein